MADDLTEAQIKAFRIADNKTAEKAEWDFELLEDELDDLFDFDMSLFGFDLEEETQGVSEDDYTPAVFEEPKSKLGDIYQLGDHRLMCGDSTSIDDVEKLMDGERAALYLSDPPYGVGIVQNETVGGGKPFGRTRSDIGAPVSFGTTSRPKRNDIVPATKYIPIKGDDTTETARENYKIISRLTDNQIIFGGNYFTDFLPPSRCWIVWEKGVPEGAFFAPVELAWVSKDANARLYKHLWSGLCREGERAIEGAKRIHPTQKPVGLMGEILKDFSNDNDIILDCFGGSGSTLIACEQLNRKCYMMEFEPHYIDVIIDRWEQFTGKKAVLLNE